MNRKKGGRKLKVEVLKGCKNVISNKQKLRIEITENVLHRCSMSLPLKEINAFLYSQKKIKLFSSTPFSY